MSEQTLNAIDQAIRDHVAASEEGDYVVGWLVVACSAIPEDPHGHAYLYEASDQPIHHTVGLIDMAREHFHTNVNGDADE